MYAVGMIFHDHLCFNTSPSFRWARIDDAYCSHCGEKNSLYGLCDSTNKLHNQVLCVGCAYISNVPNYVPATPDLYGKQVDALRDHVAREVKS